MKSAPRLLPPRPAPVRRPWRSCLAFAFAALLPGTAADAFPLLQWLHPGADPVQQLSAAPAECLDLSADPRTLLRIEAGRQLFRNPLLLGGEAARLGLSCESCHRGGTGNPAFFLAGISDAPGTADLGRLHARERLDEAPGAVPIPSLVDLLRRRALGRQRWTGPLEAFIERHAGADVRGGPWAPEVTGTLASYLRALSSGACPAQTGRPRSLGEDLYEITRSINSLLQYIDKEDEDISRLLLSAARGHLEEIQRRYAPAEAALAARITEYAQDLGKHGALIEAGHFPAARVAVRGWQADWLRLRSALEAAQGHSLYDRERLAAWLEKRD